jgi:hypothetical protein
MLKIRRFTRSGIATVIDFLLDVDRGEIVALLGTRGFDTQTYDCLS